MTIYRSIADATGLADGDLLTTSNAPPINVVTSTGTPTTPPQVSSAYPLLGRLSFVNGGGNGHIAQTRQSSASSTVESGMMLLQVPVLPAAAVDFYRVDNSGATQVAAFGFASGNQLQFKNSAGGLVGSYATALTAGGKYILKWQIIVGTTTSNGTLRCQLYDVAGTTKLWEPTAQEGTANTGTSPIVLQRNPGKATSGTTMTVAFNRLYVDNASSTEMANYDRTLTVSAGANQTVDPWAIIPLDASSTVAALGKASAVWSQVSGPTATINVPAADATYATVPPSMSQQTLVFRRTVTDYDLPTAKTVTADVTVTVRPAEFGVWVGSTLMPARFEVLT